MIVAASIAAAGAKDVHSEFSVSVTVRAVANIELQSVPADLEISAADLRRGFVDVMHSRRRSPYAATARAVSPSRS